MKKFFAVFIAAALLSFSFQDRNRLVGTSWKLILVYDFTNKQIQKSDTLCGTDLHFKDSTYGGRNGRNDYFGKYYIGKGRTLSMRRPGDTRVGDTRNCDYFFRKSLSSHYAEVENYIIRNDSLLLTTTENFRLLFQKFSEHEK